MSRILLSRSLTVLVFTLGTLAVRAQTPAFPGAQGFGAYATGGRNGTVYHVTNTNDSGAGSFRDAVSGSNRTIVFDVGGHIKLLTAVSTAGNLTIAGQTAPGGICFDGGEISFANRSNIICRYLRIRPGSDTADTTDDALSFYRSANLICDHLSIAFAPWNNIDGVGDSTHIVTGITVQNSIISNPTGQQFGCHAESVGGSWAFLYNIWANSHNRNPLAKVNDIFINNVEYNNSAGYTTHTSTSFKHDIVNNYFVAGPASQGNFPWYQVDKNQSIYYTGNMYDSNENGALDGSVTTPYWYQGTGTILSSPWSSWTAVVPTVSAALAYRYGVSTSGTFPRDDVDALLIGQIKTLGSGTSGTGAGTSGPGGSLYTSQTQTGLGNNGYGTLAGLTAPTDTDNDGMPDYWELANGSATNSANALTNTVTGYTLLENYLNYLAAPHAITQTNTAVTVNLSQFTAGFAASSTFSVSAATNGTVALQNGTNAVFTPAADFTGLGQFTFTVTEGSYSLSAVVVVCVTPLTPPASAVVFNGGLMSPSVTSQGPPANLNWRGDGTANVWNLTVSNWLNGAAPAKFKNGDVVTFDDTGYNTPNINLSDAALPGAMLFNANQNYTVSGGGSFGGSGSFSKTGSGTVTIGTTNSGFSGAINISGGTLALNSGTSIGSGAVNISGGSTLSLSSGSTAITISGSVTVPAGNNVTISSGYVANGGYGNFISGDTNSVLNFAGNQSFVGTSSSQFDNFKGTINIASGNIRFSANSSGNTFGSLNPNFIINGVLQPRNAGNTVQLGALSGSGQLQGPQTASTGSGTTVFKIGGNNQDAVFTGIIASNVNSAGSLIALVKVGTGTQVLAGANTFGGTNGILAGTLLVNGSTTPSLTTVFSGATLGGTGSITGPVSVNSGGQIAPGFKGAGTFTINGNLTASTATYNFDLSGSPSGANDRINLTGTLALTGAQTFNLNLTDNALGAGTYSLIEGATNSSASSVSLVSSLPAGTRQTFSLARPAAGSNPSYIRLTVAGTASSLVWSGTNGSAWDTATINWLNSGVADQFYNLDAVTFDDTSTNGIVSLAATLTPASIVVSNNTLAYTFNGSGALAGAGPLTKKGNGTLTIATSNSAYAGPIVVAGGTLALTAGSALGTGPMTLGGGAIFSLPSASPSVFYGGALTVPASQAATITAGALGNALSGNIISSNTTSVLNVDGGVSFSGATSAQFDNFTGTLHVLSGATLRYSAASSGNAFGSFNPALVVDGLVQPRNAGNTIQIGALTGSGTLAGPQSNGGTGDTLYAIGGNNADGNFSGVISSNSAVADSDVIVNKIGSGTLVLSGANTYAGGTTVGAGTLRVANSAGSATGTGDMEIFGGATLAGAGSIASATTVDDYATFAPEGALNFSGNLTLSDNAVSKFTLGTNSSAVTVVGILQASGTLNITNGPGFGPGTYPLFVCGNAASLALGDLALGAVPAGYNYAISTNVSGHIDLVVTATNTIPPNFGSVAASSSGLVFSGTGGAPYGTFYLLGTTNIALPVADWTRLLTNQFDADGNFNFTNPVDPADAQSFYLLQLP